ncbi:spermidine synthase-like isoform X2 [Portunus trituberculatus]|uniref:spermidine synthase-like isoform X2 n=1 Tax=Portunus trituberculatus TaxID=210409 RepID=UPI001E1CD211|nr:spermidine synthase-like isoform X2 [Portunus trituberculatus]
MCECTCGLSSPHTDMDQDLQGWFTERSPEFPGEAFSLKVKKKLLQKRSQFQNIEIFESTNHGKVLVLDGAIQFTERDEASYQEMITFLPLNTHPNPKKVLVVGGGDGGVARELTRHPAVEEVVLCEIDEEVIEACKTHVPSMGCGFSNPKLTLHTGDGAKFLEETQEKFDVIITDASDPVVADEGEEGTKDGPAVSLFNHNYYTDMKNRLEEGGILCCQGENMWLDAKLIVTLVRGCRKIFPVVEYAYTCTPTYTAGQIGFILCATNPDMKLNEPVRVWDQREAAEMGLKYYNADVHRAAFALPTFMSQHLRTD